MKENGNLEYFLINAKIYKEEYDCLLCSFLNVKKENKLLRRWKNFIYSMPVKKNELYKLDVIWCYLNDDLTYETMKSILERK